MNVNNKKIAILLGAYNAEKYLREQLDSLINQTNQDWTLYIRDDASSDSTAEIIDEYAKNYDNITKITDDLGNLGCNGNYFHILSKVESEYYMFCNADDFWIKDKIEISYNEIVDIEKKITKKPIIIHTDLSITDEKLNIIYPSLWNFDNLNPENFKNYNHIGICSIVAGATMLFNKETKNITFPVHKDAPFFDHWMAMQIMKKKGVIKSIYRPTVYYRQIGTNLAAILTGEKNTIKYKILNLKDTLKRNAKEYEMLRKIGWGGYLKYVYYKIKILFMLRFSKKP